MTTLLAVKGARCGDRFQLGEKSTLGRADDCTISLPDQDVSRLHAEIVKKRKSYTILDLDSRNGVIVNGQVVKQHVLLRNDEIRIGSTVFIFDPDFDIQNAKYSGSPVYVSAPSEETIEIRLDSNDKSAPILEDAQVSLVSKLADLLTPASHELPNLLSNLLSRLIRIFQADRAFIMLWDPVLKELETLVSISPENNGIAVSREIINTTFYEKTALLFSGEEGPRVFGRKKPTADLISSISAPLMMDENALGLIYIDRTGPDQYDLRSLGMLQAVGRLVAHAVEQSRFIDRVMRKQQIDTSVEFIGESPSLTALQKDIQRLASLDTSVLILGETGTGKELVAWSLHNNGRRRDFPFVVVNCTAVPQELFESEMFGHEKGAFTGAVRLHRGKVEMAHGGTLFLDEIGDLRPSLQAKLLRFLQEKNFQRVGGNRSHRVDVRIIAATNADLAKRVEEGAFREDLYYRLSVMTFRIPPLRERNTDIGLLADYYIRHYSEKLRKPVLDISEQALAILRDHAWPGNVRELMNVLERAVILCHEKTIGPEHILLGPLAHSRNREIEMHRSLADVEREHILLVLNHCNGNQVKAAGILGIHRNTLRKKIEEYGLL